MCHPSHSCQRQRTSAASAGLFAGWSLDIAGKDGEGKAWDLTKRGMREKATQLLLETEPVP